MISSVSEQYGIHPQTLRLYEREGLLTPSRSDGNTRLYTDEDLERLEVILQLTRELGVNLAGVEIILNMRDKMAAMQAHRTQMDPDGPFYRFPSGAVREWLETERFKLIYPPDIQGYEDDLFTGVL